MVPANSFFLLTLLTSNSSVHKHRLFRVSLRYYEPTGDSLLKGKSLTRRALGFVVFLAGADVSRFLLKVPQWCAEYCLSIHYQHGGVVCTQVHRQTAVQLALRVADEMDVNIGHEVGYVIPFENCCTSETILRLVWGRLCAVPDDSGLCSAQKTVFLQSRVKHLLC